MGQDVLVIQMQRGDHYCCNCGLSCDQAQGLPMYEGEIVPNDWAGEWCGANACRACFEAHERGEGVFSMPGPWRPTGNLPGTTSKWRRRG